MATDSGKGGTDSGKARHGFREKIWTGFGEKERIRIQGKNPMRIQGKDLDRIPGKIEEGSAAKIHSLRLGSFALLGVVERSPLKVRK